MSMPSSRALVAASPISSPRAQRRLDRRGAPRAGSRRGTPPPGPASDGSTSASCSAAVIATCSAPRRDRTNASVRTSSTTRSASRSAVSDDAARRTGAPFSPVHDVNGGSHSASATWPRGESSSVTGKTSRPVSRPAVTAGSAIVADASTNVGCAPYSAQTRRSRRSTWDDVGAEDPAVVVALVDHDVLRASRGTPAHRACPGSSERCSMSGLVRTYSPWSRVQSRCSRGLSPSWVVTRTSSAERRAGRPAGRGRAPSWARGRARWRRVPRVRRGASRIAGEGRAAGRPSDLPDAVPVASTTCWPACAASAAAAWCRHGGSIPRAAYAVRSSSGTQAGQSATPAVAGGQHLEVGEPVGPPGHAREAVDETLQGKGVGRGSCCSRPESGKLQGHSRRGARGCGCEVLGEEDFAKLTHPTRPHGLIFPG